MENCGREKAGSLCRKTGFLCEVKRGSELEELLKLHGEHVVARDLQLAAEEELHAVGLRIFHELLEVFRSEGHRAFSATRIACFALRIVFDVDEPFATAFTGDDELVRRADLLGSVFVGIDLRGNFFVEQLLNVDGHGAS